MAAYEVKMSETFVKNLDILDKTMTQISEEDRKGRYAKSFQKLLLSIKEEAKTITNNYLFEPMGLGRPLSDEEKKELQDIYTSCNKKVHEAIFTNRNVEEFYSVLSETQSDLNLWFVMHDGSFNAEMEIFYATGEEMET